MSRKWIVIVVDKNWRYYRSRSYNSLTGDPDRADKFDTLEEAEEAKERLKEYANVQASIRQV